MGAVNCLLPTTEMRYGAGEYSWARRTTYFASLAWMGKGHGSQQPRAGQHPVTEAVRLLACVSHLAPAVEVDDLFVLFLLLSCLVKQLVGSFLALLLACDPIAEILVLDKSTS